MHEVLGRIIVTMSLCFLDFMSAEKTLPTYLIILIYQLSLKKRVSNQLKKDTVTF